MACQIHVTGFSADADDDTIDEILQTNGGLREDDGWCGPGTSIIKRGKDSLKPPYAFVLFFTADAALAAIAQLNSYGLLAEAVKGRQQENTGGERHVPDLKFRRKRLPSKKKHPDGLTNGSTQDANYKKK